MADDIFYVGIKEPIEVRRLLLECSKQILQSLQDYENLSEIREEKIKKMIQLRNIIKEIYSLNSELNRALPKAQLRASQEEKPELEKTPIVDRKKELDSFEEELKKIEEKLNSLGA